MATVIPAIIPETYSDINEHVVRLKGMVKRVQVDVLDGAYTHTRPSWPYNGRDRDQFQKLVSQEEGLPLWQEFEYEVDMMVTEPESKMNDWINAGVHTLIVHLESTDRIGEIIARAQDREVGVALAFRPSTDPALIYQWAEKIEFVQCMGSDHIGAHGVELDERVVDIIKKIKTAWPSLAIGVDIGVNETTAPKLIKAGATRLVSGSAVFDGDDVEDTIKNLLHNS